MAVEVTVVYYSSTGNVYKLAQGRRRRVAEKAAILAGARV